jgi:hypothetical protein
MTLRELRVRHAGLFHPNQDWFDGERFMEQQAIPLPLPRGFFPTQDRTAAPFLVSAASLCALYVTAPGLPIWKSWLWTADSDKRGDPVYVMDQGKGLEIHRHLQLRDTCGCPIWT